MIWIFVVYVSQSVVEEFARIINESDIAHEDDHNWPQPDVVGKQELEIVSGGSHVSFTVSYNICCVAAYNYIVVF